MIHSLLVIAVVLFVLWLLFHAAGGLVNLIWLAIIVLVAIWLFGLVRSRSAS
jgi:hypothetical protein